MNADRKMLDKLYDCDIFSCVVSERSAHFTNAGERIYESFLDLTKQELLQLSEEIKQLASAMKD